MENNGVGVKRGAWTKEEDTLLKNCIEKFGEGKWHKVPSRAGLNRCRKSCRLRWLNYLRPDIKRGYFEEDEIDLILRLHKLLGNRWSLIAGRLPGRTANDVKNFWNSHILKKSSTPLAGENMPENKSTFVENNTIIKPQARTFTKSHAPLWSNEEVNGTNDEKMKNPSSSSQRPDEWNQNSNVEFPVINNVPLSEEEMDELIERWLQTPGDGDEPTPVTFSDKDDGGDTFMKPTFSPGQINQKVTEFGSLLSDVDVWDLTNFD